MRSIQVVPTGGRLGRPRGGRVVRSIAGRVPVHVNGLKYPTQICKREEMRWSKLWLGEEVRR